LDESHRDCRRLAICDGLLFRCWSWWLTKRNGRKLFFRFWSSLIFYFAQESREVEMAGARRFSTSV
jgi:hypothetical protein